MSDEFLPFEPASFDLVVCTQAFYFLASPVDAVAEIAAVLRPAGTVVITTPIAYPGTSRLYSEAQLRDLFDGWEDVSAVASGGTAVARATLSGYLLHQVEKRLTGVARPLRVVFPLLYVLVSWVGSLLRPSRAAIPRRRRRAPHQPSAQGDEAVHLVAWNGQQLVRPA